MAIPISATHRCRRLLGRRGRRIKTGCRVVWRCQDFMGTCWYSH
ncbi:hypothetical protein [Lysobacter gummosus]